MELQPEVFLRVPLMEQYFNFLRVSARELVSFHHDRHEVNIARAMSPRKVDLRVTAQTSGSAMMDHSFLALVCLQGFAAFYEGVI